MTTDHKPLTRAELLRLGAAVVNGDEDVLEAFGHAMRHLAALLPAEGLPPIDKDDERTVDALVAARTGQARRMVTHHCPDCAHHVQERDAAIARAEAAEKRVAELEARAERIHDDALRAGIREGLERAAARADRLCSLAGALIDDSFVAELARELRAMKEQVK